MPTLDWIGKPAVINHHREVPYRMLQCDPELSVGDPDSGNLLVQGDNLLALKALLPYYAGKVKCIYIDPPYNTGNENWVYNDNTNSPEIRRWLGHVVGGAAEDLSRHDKWLCMMYPRLALLYEFLAEDGAIFVSIDDNECASLRFLMDEVFGQRNFISTIVWQKIYTVKNSARHLSEMHDYVMVYAKNSTIWSPNLLPRGEKQDKAYSNPDNDPRGPWKATPIHARNYYSQGLYTITGPSGRVINGPPRGTYWRFPEHRFKALDADNQIWWGVGGDNVPAQKRFLSDVKEGIVSSTLWLHTEAGHNGEAKNELRGVLPDTDDLFITPKPTRLIERIIRLSADKDSLILDSFAGSGTTGHSVLSLNKADGGNRRFILVEMEADICGKITAQRLEHVIEGYDTGKGHVEGLGGGFRFCRLAEPLFDEEGKIGPDVKFPDLAAHVFFTETGSPIPSTADPNTPLLGTYEDTAIYLLFNGILGDKRPNYGNVLTSKVLNDLPAHNGRKIIYGEGCRLSAERLRREGITFKQVPYAIKVN